MSEQDQPWSEKIPGVTDRNAVSKAAIEQSINKILQGAGQLPGVGGGQAAGPSFFPGVAPPIPGSTISFSPTGAPLSGPRSAGATPSVPTPMTGSQSIGHFANRGEATNAGLVSLGNTLTGMMNKAEEKEHNKKAAMAENYMLQIADLRASGRPEDAEKAQMFMDDPKIRKILKEGLNYVPLEEKVPPEAQGVASAVNKISAKWGAGGGATPQLQDRTRAVMPGPSAAQQFEAAKMNALLQKAKNDPASLLSMVGVSQLSAAEQRTAEFYEKQLGMSPAQAATMNLQEKMAGLKVYEKLMTDTMKAEVDLYKADKGYAARVDAADIMAKARNKYTDVIKDYYKMRGSTANIAASAKVYADMSRQYMDIVKSGKTGDGRPLNDAQKKYYETQGRAYQKKADDLLDNMPGESLPDLMKLYESIPLDEGEPEE